MKRNKPVETSQLFKEDNLFKQTGFSGNFPIGSTKNMCSIYFLSGITGIFMSMVNNHYNQILSRFQHKFSLLVVGPTQSGKTYFVQQILKHNRIVYEEQKTLRIFWYYNHWQECHKDLKKSLGKSIRFERGVSELSKDLCEIYPRYNEVIS